MKKLIPLFTALALFSAGCGGSPMAGRFLPLGDRTPPVLTAYRVEREGALVLEFDEATRIEKDSLILDPGGGHSLDVTGSGTELQVALDPPPDPGREYKIRFDAFDERENGNWFLLSFYGANPRLPRAVINELSPKGSSTRPDMVEIYVMEPGNTAGLTLLLGMDEADENRWVLPAMEWEKGEYVILHCRPELIPEERDETDDNLSLSGGKRAVEGVRDLWAPRDLGLPGTSGIVSLMSSPRDGVVLDRIIYTNRPDDRADEKRGWTSALWEQVTALESLAPEERGWRWEDSLMPSRAVWSDGSTSTRTLCRSSDSADTDRAEDWHTGITGSASFGYPNSDEEYQKE